MNAGIQLNNLTFTSCNIKSFFPFYNAKLNPNSQPFLTRGYKKPKTSNISKTLSGPTDPIAQWLERQISNQKVECSNPVAVVAFVIYTPYQARKYRDYRQNKKMRIEIKSAFVIESSVLSSVQMLAW